MASYNLSVLLQSVLLRSGVALGIWWSLSGGEPGSWFIGIPAVVLAVFTSFGLIPVTHFNFFAFLRFIPFFLLQSLLGGIDVAMRVFHPRLPVNPGLIEYPLRLPDGLYRVFMANTINLLPGTLSVVLEADMLRIHALDSQKDVYREVESIEQRTAQIFSLRLPEQ